MTTGPLAGPAPFTYGSADQGPSPAWQVGAPPPSYDLVPTGFGPDGHGGPFGQGPPSPWQERVAAWRARPPVEERVPVERTARTRAVLGLFALVFGATLVWSLALRAFDLRPPGLPLAIGFKMASAAVGLAFAVRLGWLDRMGFRGMRRWKTLWLAWLPIGYVLLSALALEPDSRLSSLESWGVVLLCFAVGLDEEVWFRGLVLESLRHRGTQVAVIGSGVLFGLVHSVNALGADPTATVGQVVFATCFGVSLGAVRVRTGSIWPAIALHMLWDVVQILNAGGLAERERVDVGLAAVLFGTAIIGSPLLIHGLVLVRRSMVCGPDGVLPRFVAPATAPAPLLAPPPAPTTSWAVDAASVGPWPQGGVRPAASGWSWDGAAVDDAVFAPLPAAPR